MILSDKTIKERIKKGDLVIEPFSFSDIQPCSIDLHLSTRFAIFKNHKYSMVDIKKKISNAEIVDVRKNGHIIVHPNEFILGSSSEYLKIPTDLLGRLDGRSSLGRLGILIHATAGFFDPGFRGTATYEILNVSQIPVKLYAGMRVAQISFEELTSKSDVPYGAKRGAGKNKYNGQIDPTESKIWKDFIK